MTNSLKKGTLFVISGPSGVGKGTLVKMLRENTPEIKISVSATTRSPRPGEINGVHYLFLTKEDFKNKIEAGEFLEWAEFSGNFYGTNKKFVEKKLEEGQNIILEIDVQGAFQVKNKLEDAILIFIEPPCFEELQSRLFKRRTESDEEIQKRLSIVKSELEQKKKFNYTVVNDNLDIAFNNLETIILKEINKVKNQ
ncbi:MAG: guanylate kinase [bacterium]